MAMTHYIVLTIGPVQHYISQARRTQDLWQGSKILSHLARVGVDYVTALDNPAIDLIYPTPPTDDDSNLPNRMIVEYAGDDAESAAELAHDIKTAIDTAWKEIAANTFVHIIEPDSDDTVRAIWGRQVMHWLECYWVVVPAASSDYSVNIEAANLAMSARKMLRNFAQVVEHGRKCSVTGEHEALRLANRNGYDAFWQRLRDDQRNLSLLGQHERLSAIATIKRFAHERDSNNNLINPQLGLDERFPSTSSIAAMSFRYDVLRHLNELEDKLAAFMQALETLFKGDTRTLYFVRSERFPYLNESNNLSPAILNSDLAQRFMRLDGDFLFEDTYITTTIAEYAGFMGRDKTPDPGQVDKSDMAKAQKALEKLCEAAAKLDIPAPTEQERARLAWIDIESVTGAEPQKKYGTLARKLPAMIQMNGLGSTLAFLFAKGKGDKKDSHTVISQHLSKRVLAYLELDGYQSLLHLVRDADTATYRRATAEAIEYGIWLKRYVEAKDWGSAEGDDS